MDLDSFLRDIGAKLKSGWNGFTGEVVVLKQASPRGIPFEYVMQPCAVHLSYLGSPWRVVDMAIGEEGEFCTSPCAAADQPRGVLD